ncbi:battenin CLN3 protein [Lodderomyces elongisporus]|uniref:battenin CLN3 protein n=1 Tax=Lodderomyces elongisporus TaxID=36914 RepID=UPI002923825F|nr:battenin CLN3 protein [Lodderomyces elongisporus]WLF78009.1 battenin CLN3 protein [Lodderomyces elongisporus]
MIIDFINTRKIFISFFTFGLLNNILYVIILSAAIDLVGSATPKATVLLADVVPSFAFKLTAPFFIHMISYRTRIWSLVCLSSGGMLLISLSSPSAIAVKILGIMLASFSSGMGEVSFLQLTHYYGEEAIGGFSSGTGGAGLFGSFLFMLMTNILGMPAWLVLLVFAMTPAGFILTYFTFLPQPDSDQYQELQSSIDDFENDGTEIRAGEAGTEYDVAQAALDLQSNDLKFSSAASLMSHITYTFERIKPLIIPFMVPLTTVYFSEYVINQGISPTLLFPLETLPHWLFSSYRDIYVVYGFLYQLGVLISRSSATFGIRIRRLYLLSLLQGINVMITILQSLYDLPFYSIWPLLMLILYEGLLGGFAYVNTFISVGEQVPRAQREFSMGSVSISDSLGIVLAGLVNWWLETKLCNLQVDRGRDWCLKGGSV